VVDLSAKPSQQAGKPIAVTITCDEACTVSLSGSAKPKGDKKGTLKPKTVSVVPGQAVTAKVKLGKLKAELKDAGKGTAKVAATATDAAGNISVPDKAKVKLK
jgi:hypothetical protein